jgi:hypothetical protein
MLAKAGAGQGIVTAEAWRKATRPGVPIIGWLCDCLNKVPQNQVPAFEGVYYFDSHCLTALEQFHAEHHREPWLRYLPLAVNPARYPFQRIDPVIPRLVFAGKCSPHRHRLFAEMRAAGLPLDLPNAC